MKKGKRIIALFLAVLMIATSDTGVYQAFGMDAANQASEAEEAAGGEGQSSGTVDQEDISGQEQGGAGDTTNQEGGQQEAEVQTPPSKQDNSAAGSGTDAANGNDIGDAAGALETDGISTFAADSTQKIDLNAKVNNDMPAASVASGETFRYILGYNLPALGSSATYNAVTIKIPLPDHVSVAEDSSQSWGLAVTGQKIAWVRTTKIDGVNTLSITMDTGLNAGQGSDISIVLKTENFQMADGTQIILNPTMEGKAGGVTVTGSIEEASRPVVTVNAKDGWKVSKSISQDRDVRISNDAKSYEATYTINVDSTKANFNSNGRMAVTDYLLTDILPTLASAGSYDGYPDGGQPYEVAAVTMGGQPLVKGTDYDVVEEGDTVKSLKIRTYEKATQADVADYPNITEGSMMPTTYTVTLKYHRNPYIVESNKVLNKWTLTNTAQLDYALLGTAQAPSTDTAQIQLGEKEKAADPQSIVINKYLQVGTELLPMDEETSSKFHTGAVAFKLYDEDGQPAVDIEGNALKDANGNELADSTIAIGKDGSATFQNLYRGTYYIEEIVSDDSGLRVPSGKKIKVTVKNGQLALDDADGYTAELDGNGLKIVNTTDKYGMVQFYKYGKNANGKVEPLEGVKFALTLPGDETPKYTAVSEKDGRVRFQGVEPGLYEIRETSVGSNEEYVAAPGVIGTVTVTAGQIASPAFASSESTGPLANPGYVNVSPKGRFQLMKTDEKGNIITGSPATFQLYGPFETEQNINGLTEIPQEWMQKLVKKADGSAYEMSTSNGMATSIALEEGYYVLKETKEPDGYAIIENGMAQVKVAANTSDTELEVQNTPKIKVRFLKEGKVGNVTVTDSAQLTGAEFEIWDSLTGGTCLYGGEEGNPKGTLGTKLVTAVDGTGNPYTEYAQLAPGTYYYIETKAPEGFQTPDGNTRTEFTVSRGEETKDITVVNTADYGRIKLVKKDSHSGQTLAGAKFQIFMDSACKQPVTDSKGNPVVLTSADDGIAYSPLLPKGTYWLKEIEAPKGHVMSKTVIQADVGENQETEIEVSNDPEVSLKIQKTDSVTGNVITEDTASFRLKAQDDGGVWQWVQADPAVTTDGVVVFTGLVPGKAYQIYEFKSPAGYVPADLANGTLVTVVTLPSIKEDGYGEGLIYSEVVKNVPLGTYKIYKTTDFDGNGANVPLGGAVFELYQCGDTPDAAADCVEKNLVSAQTTDAGGNAQWTGLLPGEYWLKEITAEGHQLMAENPRRVSVKPGQNTEGYPDLEQVDEIQNQAKDGKVAIAKADANEPGARLANVTFSIYKEEAGVTDYSGKEVIATLTTNQDGNAISGWLEPGAYVLVEQELPDELSSYERDTTPHAFTITADKSLYLELIVTGDVSGNEYAYVVSSGEHNYTVSYNLGGRSEVVETGVIQQGDSFEFVADSFYVDANGNEWQLAASENASRTVAYGAENYSFNYVAYDPGPVSASVAFVDEYGNVLKRQSKSIAYNQGKGQVTFDLPGELEVNGRKYEIDDTLTGSLTISYMDDVLDYEISYRSVSQQEEGPYTVTVEYWEVDAAGKPVTFLGNTYFTQDTNADSDYVFNAPQTIRIRNQEAGSETYYKVVSNATITQAPKGEERLYTVGYQKYAEEEPYEWSIRLIDAETGKILKEEVKMVDAGTTEAYKAATEIEADGVKYLLDSKMEREYTHTYNQGSRIQNIYYHQESSELPASYDLTIQYMSVSDNTMLYTDKTAVTAEAGSAQVASPQNYEANGKQYVRLSGQSDVVNHDFYSAQRTYTIYYRDVNDEQNVDTVVTQEDVVTSENLVDDGTQTATVLTNATTGTTVTLNDEGVPLANTQTDDEDDNGLVTSEDEDVPLANIDGSKGGILGAAASHPVTTGVILAALLAMIGIAGYFFWKKKNEKEDAAGDGSN